MESKAYCLGFGCFFFFYFFFLHIRRVRPTLFPLAMTPWHPKNNMTPTTKCCCWLAPSKAARLGEGGEAAKGGWAGVSPRVGPGRQRDSSLQDLYKLGRGKCDKDSDPLHPVSLKTSPGLPLTAGGQGDVVIIYTPPFSRDSLTFVCFTKRRAVFLAESPFPFLITDITQTVHLTGWENFLIGFI